MTCWRQVTACAAPERRCSLLEIRHKAEMDMYARSKLAIVAVAFGLAIGAYGASAFADDGMPYVSPDGHGNCPADSTPTLFQGGIMRCHLHPRSQADCPLQYTFRVIAGRGVYSKSR
jgi:hypothetical protein